MTDPQTSTGGVTITLLPPQLVALAGGIVILVGAWLDWFRPDRQFGPAFGLTAYDVPVKFLFRDTGLFLNRGGPTIGWLLLLVGLACVVAALARPVSFLALPAGAIAFVVAVWYALRLRNFLDPLGDFGPGFADTIGLGAIAVALGGIAAAVGGVLSITRRPKVASPPT
jgi:hypothetical protein